MLKKIFVAMINSFVLLTESISYAAPNDISHAISDQNMKIDFEVAAPWNIMDGKGTEISGKMALMPEGGNDSIQLNLAVKNLEYKAGIRPAGNVVATWLRSNPPTPAAFTVQNSSVGCDFKTISLNSPCKGKVNGKLTLWGLDYQIDVPIEIKAIGSELLITGIKEIKYGQYGFGDPSSTIASLKPVIDLKFSILIKALA